YWANLEVRIRNHTREDVVDPSIAFSFDAPTKIRNNYGLVFTPAEEPVTAVEGRLVAERKIIKAGAEQSFRLAVQDGGPGAGQDPDLLPVRFLVDGKIADPPADDEPPTDPTGLAVTGTTPHSVRLAWEASQDNIAVAGYEVAYQRPLSPGPRRRATSGTVVTADPWATVAGLDPETTYSIQVRAVDVSGNTSGWSSAVPATTSAPLPDAGPWDARRAPFVDYTAWPNPKLAEYAQGVIDEFHDERAVIDAFFTGFLVTVPGGDKKVYWGGYRDYGEATSSEFGKDDFAAFRAAHGGKVILSFGGASNAPLEAEETDVQKIVDTYHAIIVNYGISHLDFDFEGAFIHDYAGQERHVAAIAEVLQAHPTLQVSYTLPADGAPGSLEGFNDGGVALLHRLAAAGIRPALLNGMLMEFGQTSPADAYECCVVGLRGMHAQISAAWPQWSDAEVWRRIGACPMYGRHINGKVFTLTNMRQLVDFALDHDLGCVSGWDATRDLNQGRLPECQDLTGNDVSKCTYVEQRSHEFLHVLSAFQPKTS
ncbi:hypothetical protein E1091_02745, partial [Micromonospora fluostatini]